MKNFKTLKCAVAFLSVALVSACTGGNNGPDHTTNADIDSLIDEDGLLKQKTTITLWSTTGTNNQPYLNSYIEAFKEVQPNITVESTIISGSYNDLKDATIKGFTSNSYPDMVACYPDHVAEYIEYDKAVELEKYMYNDKVGWTDEEYNDIITSYLDEGREYIKAGTYSVPWCKSTEQMFYNADVLIGMDLSAYDKTINGGQPLNEAYLESLTWDELFNKLCPAIQAHDDSVDEAHKYVKTTGAYHAIFAYDSDDNLFITLAKQYGYAYTSVDTSTQKASVDFNNDGMKKLLKTFHNAAEKGYIISKGSAGGNYTNEYFNVQGTLFSVGSTGGVKYQFSDTNPMNVGVARIPQADVNNPYTINQGPSACILSHNDSNRELATWLFYKFISNDDNSLDWSLGTGYSPIRQSSLDSEAYAVASDWKGTPEKTLDRVMAYSKAKIGDVGTLFVSPAFKGSSTCRTQVGNLVTKALTVSNDISEIDQWFEDAVALCKTAL